MNAPSKPDNKVAPKLTHRQALWIVAGALLPVFMGSMDQTVVSSALPSIGQALGSTSYLSWVVAANLLTMTAMTPLYGKISDSIGRRTTLLIGVSVFMLASLVSALAVNLPMLILGRALQGLGSAGMTSLAMTILGDIAAPKDRARYYTYFSIVYITSGAVGPLWGGYAAEHLHWSAIFWLNIPLGVVALTMLWFLLKKLPRHERPHKLDVLGAVLIVAASSSCMFVFNAGGVNFAWASLQIIGASLFSLICWIWFVRRLLTAAEPLIPLGVLRNRIVLLSTICNGVGWASMTGLIIYLPMFLQAVHGYSPSGAGVALIPLMMTVNAAALVGAQLAARIVHYKYPPIATMSVGVMACLWLAWRAETIGLTEMLIVVSIIGTGFGPAAPVTTVAMQNAVELHELGISTATMSFTRNIVATGIVAGYGLIVLGFAARGIDHATAGETIRAFYGSQAEAAAHFRTVFLCTAATFGISLLALIFMEEKPLMSERKRN